MNKIKKNEADKGNFNNICESKIFTKKEKIHRLFNYINNNGMVNSTDIEVHLPEWEKDNVLFLDFDKNATETFMSSDLFGLLEILKNQGKIKFYSYNRGLKKSKKIGFRCPKGFIRRYKNLNPSSLSFTSINYYNNFILNGRGINNPEILLDYEL